MESETTLLLILIILLIVLYYFSGSTDSFANINTNMNMRDKSNKSNESNESNEYTESVVLLVFLTKQCPHCVNYDRNVHDTLTKDLNSKANIKVKKVYADEDQDNLFDKHNIMFVPAGLVVKGNSVEKVNGEINFKNVVDTKNKL